MVSVPHTWKDSDVRRAVKLAREIGFDPMVIEINTASGMIRVENGRNAIEAERSPPVKPRRARVEG
jgi:hypothetical protein